MENFVSISFPFTSLQAKFTCRLFWFIYPTERPKYFYICLIDSTKSRKSPKGIRPRRCCPSPMVQNMSPTLCSERRDEHLFGRAKTGGLGQVTTKKKAPGALDPAVVLPPPRGVKYVTVTHDKSPCLCSKRHDEYLFGRAKTGGLGQVTTKRKTRKAPRALDPACCSPPPRGGVKYVTVTQDKSPWLWSERHDEHFSGRVKTGGLGQVTTPKKTMEKKGYY